MKGTKGITLVELLVVIAIIGILVIALGFSFQGWIGRYRVESTIKQIYADLMTARARAMTQHRTHFAVINTAVIPNTYSIFEDTNPAPDGNDNREAGDALLPSYPKQLFNDNITWVGGDITFGKNGTITSPNALGDTMCIFTTLAPDYDCIIISRTRINLGRIINQGGNCDAANCSPL
ncbi:MAG: prepilin-type N-terminal cleavage/methylation domain-containing protein [Porphyromonadaceae bacterium]|nr:prepilin-type N-terminal cleavage/methylation domain-containing protein [Porphyromonadaceae bacterium]